MQLKSSMRHKKSTLLIEILTVITICLYFILWPSWQHVTAAKVQLAAAQTDLRQQEKVVKSIPMLRQEKTDVQNQLEKLQESLLAEDGWTQILLQLEEDAQRSGVILDGILPQEAKEDGPYIFIPFALQMHGTYWALIDFLRFLEERSWLLNYETLTVKQEEDCLHAELHIMTYNKAKP